MATGKKGDISTIKKVKQQLKQYKRVLLVTKKPDLMEFTQIVKITGLGIIIIGSIGLIVQILFSFMNLG